MGKECTVYQGSDRSQSTITTRKDSDRSGLVKHTDDSEITCNIALNDSYNGGELLIRGIRGDIQENKIRAKVKRETGTMIIHSGRRIHEVADVTSGSRYQLICWTRNIRDLRSRSCPCCWINHREERGQEAALRSHEDELGRPHGFPPDDGPTACAL